VRSDAAETVPGTGRSVECDLQGRYGDSVRSGAEGGQAYNGAIRLAAVGELGLQQ
jgi:hypothetical protein